MRLRVSADSDPANTPPTEIHVYSQRPVPKEGAHHALPSLPGSTPKLRLELLRHRRHPSGVGSLKQVTVDSTILHDLTNSGLEMYRTSLVMILKLASWMRSEASVRVPRSNLIHAPYFCKTVQLVRSTLLNPEFQNCTGLSCSSLHPMPQTPKNPAAFYLAALKQFSLETGALRGDLSNSHVFTSGLGSGRHKWLLCAS